MITLIIIFWFCLAAIFYSYVGYGILLYLLIRLKKMFGRGNAGDRPLETYEPEVSIVVSAYNEEDLIQKKIDNTLALNYPAEKLKILFISDGSSDSTPRIISDYNRIISLHEPERKGKLAAMNRAMSFVKTPYVIFSDANTLLNTDCVRQIVKHYADPLVGGVAGEKKSSKPT